MSVKASAYRFVMRHFANMNPTRRPDTIGAMQHITETTFNTRLAADLELSQCKTPDGVRYELGSLRGTAPNGRLVLCFHGGAYLAAFFPEHQKYADSQSIERTSAAYCKSGVGAEYKRCRSEQSLFSPQHEHSSAQDSGNHRERHGVSVDFSTEIIYMLIAA